MKRDYLALAQMSVTESALVGSAANLIPAGSVLFVVRGMILAHSFPVGIATVPLTINQDMKALVLAAPEQGEYLLRALKGMKAFMLKRVQRSSHGTCRLEGSDYSDFFVPIPPLAEQHRIVAKVDELMALCDQLEAARTEREAARDRLAAASLARLNAPDPDTFQADARFAMNVLPALTARPDQVKQLRQTILNLAVRGKLVPQDPSEEPAVKMLARLTPSASGMESSIREVPFNVPSGWIWLTMRNLVLHADAGWSPKTQDSQRIGNSWGVLKVSAVSWGEFRASENKEVLPGTQPRLQAQVQRGDFLISRANTAELVARSVIVEEDPVNLMMSDKIVRLRLSPAVNPRFVCLVNNSANYAREHYARLASGVSPSMKNVSRDVILDLPIPLPPAGEQERIVEKVGELMTLCDQLNSSLTAGDSTRSRLLGTLLHEAIECPAPAAV
jgi:type I restriction enzyme S subunit